MDDRPIPVPGASRRDLRPGGDPDRGGGRACRRPAAPSAEAVALTEALAAARTGDWTTAQSVVARSGSGIATDLVLWLRLRDGLGGWGEYQAFLARDPGWPNRDTIRRHAERAMPQALPATVKLAFFREQPLTGSGHSVSPRRWRRPASRPRRTRRSSTPGAPCP